MPSVAVQLIVNPPESIDTKSAVAFRVGVPPSEHAIKQADSLTSRAVSLGLAAPPNPVAAKTARELDEAAMPIIDRALVDTAFSTVVNELANSTADGWNPRPATDALPVAAACVK